MVGKHDRDSVWELGVKAAFCLGTSSLMSLGAAFFLWCYKIKEETKTTIQRVSWFTLLYLVAILGVCIGGETCLAKVVKWGNGISDDDLRAKTNLTIVMFCCGLEAFFTVVYSLYIYDIRGAVFHHDYTGDPL
ncbi:unnamed protein product [Cuscuta europaea]|uniref:Uncharacterized protein n=1 Tax=Cuscuta europaea TaxID=41803 RepID=A0A9P0YJG1_CUSEU|nr:unnamed protein product [Cuscuta europaea]